MSWHTNRPGGFLGLARVFFKITVLLLRFEKNTVIGTRVLDSSAGYGVVAFDIPPKSPPSPQETPAARYHTRKTPVPRR